MLSLSELDSFCVWRISAREGKNDRRTSACCKAKATAEGRGRRRGIIHRRKSIFAALRIVRRHTKQESIETAVDILNKIIASEDDVSKRLNSLFKNSHKPTEGQLSLARKRKEVGNPPGKPENPLGDQITWEQLLAFCKEKKPQRIWIVTNDHDFFKPWRSICFLNAFLHQDLVTACHAAIEIHCFNNLLRGVKDFDKEAGANAADELMTPEESIEVEKELEATPDWLWAAGDAAQNVVSRAGSVVDRVPPWLLNPVLQATFPDFIPIFNFIRSFKRPENGEPPK
jgi:hypothetical protein